MFRFFKSTGISSQRTVAAKATIGFPGLVRSFGLYKFCLEVYISGVIPMHEYYLHIENNFETKLIADLFAKDT